MVSKAKKKSLVLSKQQQNKSLAAKKINKTTKKKKTLRNILASPNSVKYWPLLDEQDDTQLQKVMESILPSARLPKNSCSNSALRREAKKNKTNVPASSNETNEACKKLRSCLLFGSNEVVKALEKGETSLVLITADINPPAIAHVILNLCATRQVPALVMNSLRASTATFLGFSCTAFGIRSNIQADSLKVLLDMGKELSSKFPQAGLVDRIHVKQEVVDPVATPSQPTEKINITKFDPYTDVYQFRATKTVRTFVPGGGVKRQPAEFSFKENSIPEPLIKESHIKNDDSAATVMQTQEVDRTTIAPENVSLPSTAKVKVEVDNGESKTDQEKVSQEVAKEEVSVSKSRNRKRTHEWKKSKLKNKETPGLDAAEVGMKEDVGTSNIAVVEYLPLTVKTIQSNPNKIKKKKK